MQNIFMAYNYAAQKHKGQVRKGNDKAPYINHPISVVHTLTSTGNVVDNATIIAGILHDVIEDTNTNPNEIAELFSWEIANIVLEISDKKNISSDKRKAMQIFNASKLTHKAKLIRIADKICNVRDIIDFPPRLWNIQRRINYLLWTKKVLDEIKGTHIDLENLYLEVFNEGMLTLKAINE
ncbi:MAG: HD domain-containing protein [Bacteroidales bacterium]|nr:HD domain-containing protein [Bacteroidales bacterium]